MPGNGSQFSSLEFHQFAEDYDFVHITSSPYNPRSNGAAEHAVRLCKEMLNQEDPWFAMLNYRDTVIPATGKSPAELMTRRHLRTKLPILPQTLTHRNMNMDIVPGNDEKHRENYANYYDKHHVAKPLPDLRPGDHLKIKTDDQKKWGDSGKVISQAQASRSYHVQTQKGNVVRRNHRNLMKTPSRLSTTQSNSHVRVPPTVSPPMITSQFNLQPNFSPCENVPGTPQEG